MRRLASALRARFTVRRTALAAGLIAAFLAILALAEGDSDGAPADHAASLVPEQALAYAHVSVKPDSQQWRDATRLARGFPRLVQVRDRFLRSLTAHGGSLDLEHEVYPWIDDEAALALLAGSGGKARSLILLEVSDRELADAFLARAVGQTRRTAYHGVAIRSYGRLATAFVGDFLVIGEPALVRTAVDVQQGRVRSLDRTAPFVRSRTALPDKDRLFFGYGTREGVRRVLRTQPGVFGRLAQLADDPDLLGASVAARTSEHGIWIDYAAALRPVHSQALAERPFAPELHKVVPSDAVAFLDMRGADRLVETIAKIAGSNRLPGSLGAIAAELSGARRAELRRALRPLLGREAALYLSPSGQSPVLTMVVNHVNGDEIATMIEQLQPLIARILERPAEGQVPIFQPTRIGDQDAVTLTITPSVELTFAVIGGRAVISTAPAGIRQITSARSRIAGNELFRAGTGNSLESMTSVLFLDLEQFFAIGEQAGLRQSPSFRAFQSALGRVSTVSAVTSSTRAGKTATIFIEVP
jgi:hypothetical protein